MQTTPPTQKGTFRIFTGQPLRTEFHTNSFEYLQSSSRLQYRSMTLNCLSIIDIRVQHPGQQNAKRQLFCDELPASTYNLMYYSQLAPVCNIPAGPWNQHDDKHICVHIPGQKKQAKRQLFVNELPASSYIRPYNKPRGEVSYSMSMPRIQTDIQTHRDDTTLPTTPTPHTQHMMHPPALIPARWW